MMPLQVSGTILASLIIINSQDVTSKSATSTILSQVATSQTDDMFIMFKQLARQYTPPTASRSLCIPAKEKVEIINYLS